MTTNALVADDVATLHRDVLVIGGGPAGCWAALKAAQAGATVLLAEKGFVGTSGATAAGNTTVIDTARGTKEREATVGQRLRLGHGLTDRVAIERVLDTTRAGLDQLAEWGYRFSSYEDGRPFRGMLRGADYLRFMRQRLRKLGVTILDHSPAEALLVADGMVGGAVGRRRMDGEKWRVQAGAVVLATGGCAFLSGALGTNNLTGDGYLMGAEAGALLSGMEFSGQYGISAIFSSVTKGIVYFWASFSTADGTPIEIAGERQDVARQLREGPVYAILDKAPPRVQQGLREGQPNIMVPFDRMGIDPFTERFQITLRSEGTVRGTGGLLTDAIGATTVPGLYAAGDAASREVMSGAVSGGGGPNASWALATGSWAGAAAASFATRLGAGAHTRVPRQLDGAAPEPGEALPVGELIRAIQAEILPLDRGFFRTEAGLRASAARLAELRQSLPHTPVDGPREALRLREAAALLATARWATDSALARTETRGIHRREDFPGKDPAQERSLVAGGVGEVWARPAAAREVAV